MRISSKQARELGIHLPGSGKKKLQMDGKTGSDTLMDAMCAANGLPIPVKEYQFHPTRLWRFDYVFEGWLALEVEGGVFAGGRHSRGAGFREDVEKYNEAVICGYSVLRCLPEQIESGEIFQTVRRALEAREEQH